jgi:hypothetical protein
MSVDNRIFSTARKSGLSICRRYRDGAICVPFETVAEYNQDKNREIFKHSLVYIFHDVPSTRLAMNGIAKKVTQSCSEAIKELATMIPKIHASYNVTEVYVTSDHGFLFNDIQFAEKDKHKINEETLERSTRYYLTNSEKEESAASSSSGLNEVSAMVNACNVICGSTTRYK